jgi:hypothetical protein
MRDTTSVVDAADGGPTEAAPPRRRAGRRNLAIALAALFLAGLCTQVPFVVDEPYEPWIDAIVAADGRSAVVRYDAGGGRDLDNPCVQVTHVLATVRGDVMELAVRASDKRRLLELPSNVVCGLPAQQTTEVVELPEPLNGRRVVDALPSTRLAPGIVFDRRPAIPYTAPPGLTEVAPDASGTSERAVLVRHFERGAVRFEVTEDIGAVPDRAEESAPGVPITVGAAPGELVVRPGSVLVRWRHGGRSVTVAGHPGLRETGNQAPSADEVLAVAQHVERGA